MKKTFLDASSSCDESTGPSGSTGKKQKLQMTEKNQEKEDKDHQELSFLGSAICHQPATMLQIGSWIKVPRRRDDIVATIYCSKLFVWEFFDEFEYMVKRIVIAWSNILAINANIEDNRPGILEIELRNPPHFFKKKWGLEAVPWQLATDFTDDQASIHRRHYVQFSQGILEKFFEDHFLSDQRLVPLTQVYFPSIESLFFDVQRDNIGVALNLVPTPHGGAVIYIKTTVVEQGEGKGKVVLTRRLGQHMDRYAKIARTVARKILIKKQPETCFFANSKLQLDVPPTAMVCASCTMITSMLSLAMQKPVKMDLAMCGRVNEKGRILRIEGMKEYTIAAQRKRVKTLIFPSANKQDLTSLASNEKEGLDFHFVDTYSQIYDLVFGDD